MPLPSIQDLYVQQMANLPILHPDELLYSWIGRVHQLNAISSVKWTSQTLFGNPYAALAHDFPSHLEHLQEHVGALIPNIDHLMRSHSLLGFYLPWLPTQRAQLAFEYGRCGAHPDIKHLLGLPASRLGANHPLKACPTCIQEDVDRFGYAYWHVQHQYPTTWICGEHNVALSAYKAIRSMRHYRHFIAPNRVDAHDWVYPEFPTAAASTLSNFQSFSMHAAKLSPAHFNIRLLAMTYRSALQQQGLLTDGGSIRIRGLIELVREKYRPIRSVPGFHIIDSLTDEWAGFVGDAARPRASSTHPMKHLMLINVIFDGWQDFISKYSLEPAKRAEPLPQPEKDTRQELFTSLVINEGLGVTAAGRHVGVSSTTAVRWAKLNRIYYTPRTKYVSHEVWEKCRGMLRGGEPKSRVASEAGISMTSVTRLLSSEPELRAQWQDAIFRNRRKQYRQNFAALYRSNSGVPLRLIRRMPENRYAWLYRHDREWLTTTMSKLTTTSNLNTFEPRPPNRASKRVYAVRRKPGRSTTTANADSLQSKPRYL